MEHLQAHGCACKLTMSSLSSQSIGFYRILLLAPHFSVRDLGRLAITSAVFGRRGDSRFGQRAGLNLVEQAIRCRCCSILKQKLETERQAIEVERLDSSQTAWRRLFCLTEPTCKKCKGAGTTFLPKKLRKLAKTQAEKAISCCKHAWPSFYNHFNCSCSHAHMICM